ncbi:MAG: histidinol-phosphatase HisJ family protein [Armatimonadetes bacterium]|nr:histidinol-phosphatase HisJ family protein [Armatimonadota bacterium]
MSTGQRSCRTSTAPLHSAHMVTSYHNHTLWSDGLPTLEEQIQAAIEQGLDEFGLSDHYVVRPDGHEPEWSMPLGFLDEYVSALKQAGSRQSHLIIRTGIEADFIPETISSLEERLALHPFDYVIGSVHFLGEFAIDADARDWEALTQDQINDVWEGYWKQIAEMASSRVFDFAAHLDLPKKFGFRPSVDFSQQAIAALDAISKADMAIEINTAGWHKPVGEAYPSLSLLKAARDRNIPLLINADAHESAHLSRDFDRARELAREAGYRELVRYERRRRIVYPMD